MRIPRYYQQEQYTDRPSSIFQPQPFVSPLETVGQGVGNILERVSAQDQQIYLAEESAKAQAKVFDVADGLEQEIQNGEILDQKTLEETFKTRVNESYDELQLTPKVRKSIQPDTIRLMSVNGLKLNKVLSTKRADMEAASLNESIDTFKRKAIEALSDDELNQYLDLIRGTVSNVEGTFLDAQRKQNFLSSTLDFVHSSRVNRLLLNPANDPATIKEYLTVRKDEITPETREKLLSVVESSIQKENDDELFFGIVDRLELAEMDGGNLDAIRKDIEANRRILGRETTFRLQKEADRIEKSQKTGAAELVVNQIERAVNLEKDFGKATRILQEHRSLFDQNDFDDVLLKIDVVRQDETQKLALKHSKQLQNSVLVQVERALALEEDFDKAHQILSENQSIFEPAEYDNALLKIEQAQKSQVEQERETLQWSNVPSFQTQIEMGAFDQLNSQQMRQQLTTEIAVNGNLPRSSMLQLMNGFETHKRQMLADKIKNAQENQAILSGMKPSDDKTALKLWNAQPSARTDPQTFSRFIDRYGTWKFQFDHVKDLIFNSTQSADFARGVEMGVQLWFRDPKQFKQSMDEDTRKAIFWGYQEMRNVDDQDYEVDPATGERVFSSTKNLQNANDRIKKRLFPEKEMLGISPGKYDMAEIKSTANSVLDNVFYSPGGISRATGVIPLASFATKMVTSLFGSQTLGLRSEAGFSTYWKNIPAPPPEAREFYSNLVQANVLDGIGDYQKAAELALPEFLDTYGVTRIGVKPGTGYWQATPPEWFIKKTFHSEDAYENAVKLFTHSVYQKAVDITANDPHYEPLRWVKEENLYGDDPVAVDAVVIPPIRLIPILNTMDKRMPDYWLGYEDEKTGMFVQLKENNQPVTIRGEKVLDELRNNSNRELFYEAKGINPEDE